MLSFRINSVPKPARTEVEKPNKYRIRVGVEILNPGIYLAIGQYIMLPIDIAMETIAAEEMIYDDCGENINERIDINDKMRGLWD